MEPSCNEARLVDSGSGYFSNNTFFRVGVAEICVNNSYIPVCGTLTQEEALLLCVDSEGRYGEWFNVFIFVYYIHLLPTDNRCIDISCLWDFIRLFYEY